jgi:hypothetical protein
VLDQTVDEHFSKVTPDFPSHSSAGGKVSVWFFSAFCLQTIMKLGSIGLRAISLSRVNADH